MDKSFLMSFSYKHADRRTSGQQYIRAYIYPPLDKRDSPIISSICGPNNEDDTEEEGGCGDQANQRGGQEQADHAPCLPSKNLGNQKFEKVENRFCQSANPRYNQ